MTAPMNLAGHGLAWRLLAYAAGTAVVATCVLAISYGVVGRGGLRAVVLIATHAVPQPVHGEDDRSLTPGSTRLLLARAEGAAARIDWSGFIHVTERREYAFRVAADAPIRLWIDNRVIFEHQGSREPEPARVHLPAGQHVVYIQYGPAVGCEQFDFQWDGDSRYRLTTVPIEALSAAGMPSWKWRVRKVAPRASALLAALWALLIITGLLVAVSQPATRAFLEVTPALRAALGAAAIIAVAGIWWGEGWAPDEIDPPSVMAAIDHRFANGWHERYPPLQYYLLGLAFSPAIAADRLRWLVMDSAANQQLLFIVGRCLTVAMAMAALLGVAALAARTLDRRHAWPAVLCAAAFLPFPFYAKTANLDVPYLCWFVWSVVFLLEFYQLGSRPAAVLFGIMAAAAIATKDQAYGLFVLPAALLVLRFGRTLEGWKTLGAATLAGLVTLAVCFNLLFNAAGFVQHVAVITGPASGGYRMYSPTAGGQWMLLKATAGQVVAALGVGGLALVVASVGSPHYARMRWAFALLALCLASYYLTFVAVVGYVYDRFLLPATVLLALPASVGARRLLDATAWRPAARLAAVLLLAWTVARAASLDLLLIRDSRFAAERWLEAHVSQGDTVASIDQFGYLPRLHHFDHLQIEPTIPATLAVNPQFIVVNREFIERSSPDSDQQRWLGWLESGAAPFAEAFRYKASLRWWPLWWDERFWDRREDPFTNLDKVNPEIVIFERMRQRAASRPDDQRTE